jgi:hypothetical protein
MVNCSATVSSLIAEVLFWVVFFKSTSQFGSGSLNLLGPPAKMYAPELLINSRNPFPASTFIESYAGQIIHEN